MKLYFALQVALGFRDSRGLYIKCAETVIDLRRGGVERVSAHISFLRPIVLSPVIVSIAQRRMIDGLFRGSDSRASERAHGRLKPVVFQIKLPHFEVALGV